MNRKYNLDYLEWLQKNARLYMAGLAALTLFIVASWCLYFEPWQPQGNLAFWDSDSDQAVAEQQTPQPDEQIKETETAQNTALTSVQDDTTKPVPQPVKEAEPAEISGSKQQNAQLKEELQEEPKETVVDLFAVQNQLAGFTAPCDGQPVYVYGLGYNPVYEDYRVHDHLCYQADGADVKAAAEGIVQCVDFENEWQLVLTCGDYQIRYQGLQTCSLQEGETVKGGQIIGTAGKYLKVQTVKQE